MKFLMTIFNVFFGSNIKHGKAHDLQTWFNHMFFFHREKVFRKLFPVMTVLTVYALSIVIMENYWTLFDKIHNPNLGQFHLVFSFVLSIVISFRVNTTYSRWWEGRNLWGTLVNDCRNVSMKFENFAGLAEHHEFYDFLRIFPQVLKSHLRKDVESIIKEFASIGIMYDPSANVHPCVYLANHMYRAINQLRKDGVLTMEQYLSLDTHIVSLINVTGGCERIASTPVPISFSFFVKQGLLFYSLIFPFGWADKFGYLIIPMMLVMLYILLGLELMAEELEDPFGTDDNDLQLDTIAGNILRNVKAIAEHKV